MRCSHQYDENRENNTRALSTNSLLQVQEDKQQNKKEIKKRLDKMLRKLLFVYPLLYFLLRLLSIFLHLKKFVCRKRSCIVSLFFVLSVCVIVDT